MTMAKVARRYAQAFLDAAAERGILEEVRSDAEGLLQLLEDSDDFQSFLKNPIIETRFKRQTFQELFEDKLNRITLNFLCILADQDRESLLKEILQESLRLFDEREGIIAAEVKSAVELTEEQKERLEEKLSIYSGRKVRAEVSVEPSLKGGFVVNLQDTVIDASLAKQLELMKMKMIG